MMFLASTNTVGAGVAMLVGIISIVVVLAIAVLVAIAAVKFFKARAKKKKAAVQAAEAPAPEVEAPPAPTAPGSAGGIKLYDVEPKTAAMLMAIVADKMGKPLNELRFISIKEVK